MSSGLKDFLSFINNAEETNIIIVDDINSEFVHSFTYLGKKITYDGKNTLDIKCRIAQANQVFYKNKNLYTI